MIPITVYRRLYASLKEHRQVEADIFDLLTTTLGKDYVSQKKYSRPNPLAYVQKNFFSILFLAIYRAIGIPPEKRKFYGMINHCLRGIVTGADNILDDEYKEMLPLNFPTPAVRFKSVMHILLFDRFLVQVTDKMAKQGLITGIDPPVMQQKLFEALVPIGAEEAHEEGGIYEILKPSEILSTVHMYKGGRLLCLAFVAPLLAEPTYHKDLELTEKGIYSIGLALQLIDDLTDFYEDIANTNHNYLVSSIYFRGSTSEKTSLNKAMQTSANTDKEPIETLFPESVRQVMEEAIGEALQGFAYLENAGFWVNSHQAYNLIKNLFVLRGVRQLLPFFPSEQQLTHSVTCPST